VSAHLGDGYPYDLLRKNIYAVSNERVMVECVFNPAPPFSVGIAYGRYYHTCYQKELTDRAEFSLFYETPELFFFIPYVWIRNTAINKKKWSFGFDTSVGIYTTKKKRGITMSLRYFNRLHPGYYVDRREIGTGFQLTFLP